MAKVDTDIGFPSAEAVDAIAVTAATDTTEKEITVTLPSGASIVRATLMANITAMNNSANAQKIGVDVKGRISGGSFSTFFSQANIMGMGAVDGATTGLVAISDVTALVTTAGTYGFKCTITQSSANSVRYTTQYVLIITFRF
jgi:carbon monoxide dehydrogenase subunit G